MRRSVPVVLTLSVAVLTLSLAAAAASLAAAAASLAAAAAAAAQRPAPGGPGAAPTWAPADKHGFGTAAGLKTSRVWFTLGPSAMTEAYYPDLSTPSIRSTRVTPARLPRPKPGGDLQVHMPISVRARARSLLLTYLAGLLLFSSSAMVSRGRRRHRAAPAAVMGPMSHDRPHPRAGEALRNLALGVSGPAWRVHPLHAQALPDTSNTQGLADRTIAIFERNGSWLAPGATVVSTP
jgi:hypothetical protein